MISSLRGDVTVYDKGDHWRGGQIIAIGASITIKYLAEAYIVRTAVVATALVPIDARSLGCPVAVRVTGGGADSYTIVECIGSTFGSGAAPKNGFYDATTFNPGIVPRSITNEPLFNWTGA